MSLMELVDAISSQAKVSKTSVATVLRLFGAETLAALRTGDTVKLPGFGTFSVVARKAKTAFGRENPPTKKIKFKQSRKIRLDA